MGKGRGWGRETPEPTLMILNFFVWFFVLNYMCLSRGPQMSTAYQIEANFQKLLNDYWSVSPTRRGIKNLLDVPDVADFINTVYIPNFVNYDPADSRTSLYAPSGVMCS